MPRKILVTMALPCLILFAVSMPLAFALESHFALAGLRIHQPAVVTVQFRKISDATLSVSPDLRVETEGVRVPALNQISWRISPLSRARNDLTLRDGIYSVSAHVAVGSVLAQPPGSLQDPNLLWMQIAYPNAVILGTRWPAWFLLFSFAGALLAAFFRFVLNRSARRR